MNHEKEKAIPGDCGIGNGKGLNSVASESKPISDFTTIPIRTQGRVEKMLSRGEENALTAKELTVMLGVPSTRKLTVMIEVERDKGAPILSACHRNGGYFLPDYGEKGRREVNRFRRTQESRIRSINTMKNNVLRGWNELCYTDQESLPDEAIVFEDI